MLWKLIFVATAAVGVFGRSTFDLDYDPFSEQYSQIMATDYCQAIHAENKTPEVKAALMPFVTCLNDVIDTAVIAKELEEAEIDGAYDGMIRKYCSKAARLKVCAAGLYKGMTPCLPAGAALSAEKNTNITIDFFCDNDGAWISSFVKEDGPKCIKQQMFDITFCQQAMKANITKIANISGDRIDTSMAFSEKDRCIIGDQGMECLVNAMSQCPNKVPAKLIQEFHDIYLKRMSCSELTNDKYTVEAPAEIAEATATGSSHLNKDIDRLKKFKLELEVRAAELEIWNRENELKVQHTGLTSDVKTNVH